VQRFCTKFFYMYSCAKAPQEASDLVKSHPLTSSAIGGLRLAAESEANQENLRRRTVKCARQILAGSRRQGVCNTCGDFVLIPTDLSGPKERNLFVNMQGSARQSLEKLISDPTNATTTFTGLALHGRQVLRHLTNTEHAVMPHKMAESHSEESFLHVPDSDHTGTRRRIDACI
jgi:hypothetical protein